MPDRPSRRLALLDPRSRKILEDAGFTWDGDTGMWINNALGRAISYETVRDHTAEWLQNWLDEIGRV